MPSSRANRFGSDILTLFHYNYNSGGWDDYPPQHHLLFNPEDYERVAPIVTTAHAIRAAKILLQAARALGLDDDVARYERDIERFSRAVQTHAWDDDAGYYGYVVHDESGTPTGIYRHESGANFNMGMDGATPLVAGVTDTSQTERLTAHLMTEGELWTRVGLTTVDMRVPYFKEDGYWNGAVWMPHQWFFWKALLDYGKMDEAYRIAETALTTWKTEVDATYNCYEHFLIESGRGCGWHQFSGLSTPVLKWYTAYFCAGSVTAGFDAWFVKSAFNEDATAYEGEVEILPNSATHAGVIISLAEGHEYRFTLDGEEVPATLRSAGTYELRIPRREGRIAIRARAL